tara:strand:+ start:48446 stop:48562 length:117 start_codon:yes stop_codon:yes gene_type:complete
MLGNVHDDANLDYLALHCDDNANTMQEHFYLQIRWTGR